MRLRGTNQLAEAPVGTRAFHTATKRRILLVHGYNVREDKGLKTMGQFRTGLSAGCLQIAGQILTMTWPGNADWLHGGPIAYFAKVDTAVSAGDLLFRYTLDEYGDGGGCEEMVVVAHSLGCRVALEFLKRLSHDVRPAKLKKIAVILMAAAVPSNLHELLRVTKDNADYLAVLHSQDDAVLRRWFRLGQTAAGEGNFPEAVGLRGEPRSSWSFDQQMRGFDHGDYWKSAETAEVIGLQLEKILDGLLFWPDKCRESYLPIRDLGGAPSLPERYLPLF